MKIALVVSTFPPRVGGMGQVCFEEAKRLAGKHDITVFTPRYRDSSFNLSSKFKIEYLKPRLLTDNSAWLPGLTKKLKGFDLIHLHFPFYLSAHSVYRSRQKYVITYHMDAQVKGWKSMVQKIYDYCWTKRIFSKAAKIITIDKDHFANSKFKELVDKGKLVELHNAVDTKVFSPQPVEREEKTVLFVGNLLPFKRFDLLLQAIKNLDAKVRVVGGGYEIERYKNMIKELGIESKVEFHGFCKDRAEMAKLYSSATCLAVCSDSGESFSLAAIEALACGCPVVASDIPGVRGRVIDGQTGFIFKSNSVDDLVRKLDKILELSTADRQAMQAKCRADAQANYSWLEHIEKLENIYKTC